MKALAQHSAGDEETAVKTAQELAENYPENASVLVCAGTVLAATGREEEALGVLSKHQGSLDAYVSSLHCYGRRTGERLIGYRVALIVQIHLQQNRTDLALKEVQAAKRWAQDSLLVNLAESWVGMRVVCSIFLYAFV